MKNYNKILEAVNRGIKFALSDLEDDEELSSVGSLKLSLIVNNNSTKNLLNVKSKFIDLDLPSGTKWFKYNLGVDYKKLDKNPENSVADDLTGDFYAFAETETKPISQFTSEFYKYGNYDPETRKLEFTKYNDGLTKPNRINKLEITDDAAYMNNPFKQCGIDICLPTLEQCEELRSHQYTEKRVEKNYLGIQGLNVVICTSKINGNEIVFPLNGIILFGKLEEFGKETRLMNSFIGDHAWLGDDLTIREGWTINNPVRVQIDGLVRSCGRNVRPVLMKK